LRTKGAHRDGSDYWTELKQIELQWDKPEWKPRSRNVYFSLVYFISFRITAVRSVKFCRCVNNPALPSLYRDDVDVGRKPIGPQLVDSATSQRQCSYSQRQHRAASSARRWCSSVSVWWRRGTDHRSTSSAAGSALQTVWRRCATSLRQ